MLLRSLLRPRKRTRPRACDRQTTQTRTSTRLDCNRVDDRERTNLLCVQWSANQRSLLCRRLSALAYHMSACRLRLTSGQRPRLLEALARSLPLRLEAAPGHYCYYWRQNDSAQVDACAATSEIFVVGRQRVRVGATSELCGKAENTNDNDNEQSCELRSALLRKQTLPLTRGKRRRRRRQQWQSFDEIAPMSLNESTFEFELGLRLN